MGSLLEKFESRLMPEPNSGCWLWIGKVSDSKGYGVLYVGNYQWEYAHRVAWQLFRGAAPGVLHVLHRCDNPSCVNPDHLFLGTQADNNADKLSKGRNVSPRGEKNARARLTDDLVRRIRKSHLSSLSLAPMIGIDASSIRKVRRGETWGHVDG